VSASESPCAVHAQKVADEVSARYGVPVRAEVVKTIPRGHSALPSATWDGRQLVSNEAKVSPTDFGAINHAVWQNRLRGERLRKADALAKCKTDAESQRKAEAIIRRAEEANTPRKARPISATMQARRGQVADLHRRGFDRKAIAAATGLSLKSVVGIAAVMKLQLAQAPKAAKPAAQITVIERRQRLPQLLDAGAKVAELTQIFGVKRRTLQTDCQSIGRELCTGDGRRAANGNRLGVPRDRWEAHLSAQRQERAKKLPQLVAAGLTRFEIAAALGVSASTIRSELRALDLRSGGRRSTNVEARRQEVLVLVANGFGTSKLARHFRVHESTIRLDMRALGLPVDQPKAGPTDKTVVRRRLISELVAKGFSRSEISEKLSISADLLNREIRRAGIAHSTTDGAKRQDGGLSDEVKVEGTALCARVHQEADNA